MDEKGKNFEAENKIPEDNGGDEVNQTPVNVPKDEQSSDEKCCDMKKKWDVFQKKVKNF